MNKTKRSLALVGALAALAVAAPPSATAQLPSRPGVTGSYLSQAPARCAQTDGRVNDIEILGGVTYIGGAFTRVTAPDGSVLRRDGAAAIDTATCAVRPWNPGVDGEVLALAATADRVYLGGKFSGVGGSNRRNLAAVDTVAGAPTSFAPAVRGFVGSLDTSSSRLYAAGGIKQVNGTARNKAAAFSLATGALDPGWRPSFDARVQALAVAPDGSAVYVGGVFSTINGVSSRSLGAVDLATGALSSTFKPGTRVPTTDLVVSGSRVFAGMAGQGGRVAVFDTTGRVLVEHRVDGNVQAVGVRGDEALGGGHFTRYCYGSSHCAGTIDRRKVFGVSLGSAALTDFAPDLDSVKGVWAMAIDPTTGRLFLGGDFTRVGTTTAGHLAAFDPR